MFYQLSEFNSVSKTTPFSSEINKKKEEKKKTRRKEENEKKKEKKTYRCSSRPLNQTRSEMSLISEPVYFRK